jgi:hypothetical protein
MESYMNFLKFLDIPLPIVGYYIIVKIQRYNNLQWEEVYPKTLESSYNFPSNGVYQLKVPFSSWNILAGTSPGRYRVYAAVYRDGEVVLNKDGSYAEEWDEFDIVN